MQVYLIVDLRMWPGGFEAPFCHQRLQEAVRSHLSARASHYLKTKSPSAPTCVSRSANTMLFNLGHRHPGSFGPALPCCGRGPGPQNGALAWPASKVVFASHVHKDFDTGCSNFLFSRILGFPATPPREHKPPGPGLLKEVVPPVWSALTFPAQLTA